MRRLLASAAILVCLTGCASLQYAAAGCREGVVFLINPELNAECARLLHAKLGGV